jgi:hypothetical protein
MSDSQMLMQNADETDGQQDCADQLKLDLEAPPFKPLGPPPKSLLKVVRGRKNENPEDSCADTGDILEQSNFVATEVKKMEKSKLPTLSRGRETKLTAA